jgi:hypothetical protein
MNQMLGYCRIIFIIPFLFIVNCKNVIANKHYFYTGRNFGSEALFNPINMILNGGYGIMQLDGYSRDVVHTPYRLGAKNVWYNITNSGGSIRRYGWGNFLSNEIFPISFKREYMQWLPNYELHLIGGGMTSRAIYEWYEAHNYPAPKALMIATMGAYYFLNEVVENGSYQGDNVDPIADIDVFDVASVALFSFEGVDRFFSEKLYLSDWSLMPSFDPQDHSIQNNCQNFSLKWKLPFLERWHFFRYFGLTDLTGASYKLSNGSYISFGGGVRTKTLITLDESKRRKTISMVGNVGLFYDRDNSLLCSILFGGSSDKRLNINIYPGVVHLWRFTPGLWTIMNRKGNFTIGMITTWTTGMALRL